MFEGETHWLDVGPRRNHVVFRGQKSPIVIMLDVMYWKPEGNNGRHWHDNWFCMFNFLLTRIVNDRTDSLAAIEHGWCQRRQYWFFLSGTSLHSLLLKFSSHSCCPQEDMNNHSSGLLIGHQPLLTIPNQPNILPPVPDLCNMPSTAVIRSVFPYSNASCTRLTLPSKFQGYHPLPQLSGASLAQRLSQRRGWRDGVAVGGEVDERGPASARGRRVSRRAVTCIL